MCGSEISQQKGSIVTLSKCTKIILKSQFTVESHFVRIFCLFFRAVVFISHGVTEHSGRFHKLATFLQENQFTVYAHDHGM